MPEPPQAETVVRAALRALQLGEFAALASLLHPEIEAMTVATGRQTVRGPAAILESLKRAADRLYAVYGERLEPLDSSTVLVLGRARYPADSGGFGDAAFAWLYEVRDNLVWRVRVFPDEAQARRAHEADAR